MDKLNYKDIEEAIEDIRNGKIIIVADDEHRENEGDFIAAAEKASPEIVNFMAKHGKGLICVALTEERCEELDLHPMVESNTAVHSTNFTVSIDLIGSGCTTGISAHDRAKTILSIVNKDTKPEDLGRPGHIFPIKAHPGGLRTRRGHTEATVQLAKMAGLFPAGFLVEIIKADGTMARYPDLEEVAEKFKLKLITIKRLVEYMDLNNIA